MGFRRAFRSFFTPVDEEGRLPPALGETLLFKDEEMAEMLPNDLLNALSQDSALLNHSEALSSDCGLPVITADLVPFAVECPQEASPVDALTVNDVLMEVADNTPVQTTGQFKKPLLDIPSNAPVALPNEFVSSPTVASRRRAPSMASEGSNDVIPPQAPEDRGKLTVVLDLDETLVYAREGPILARPQLDILFEVLGDRCETIVWTAGIKSYAQNICKEIDKNGVIRHCIYRHHKWFGPAAREKWFGCMHGGSYTKDLTILGRDLERTIIIENTPTCVASNPHNGIIVSDYIHANPYDHTIPVIASILTQLLDSQLPVPQFLANCNLLRKQHLVMPNSNTAQVFFLDVQCALLPPPMGDSDMDDAPFTGF